MIHLFSPLNLNGRFSVQDMPDALHLPLLNGMVVPRIVSSSMTPTVQEGDRLELRPPTPLTVGAIVVFRNDRMLVCHRVTAIDPQGILSTKGDATDGACEVVQPGFVIGVVTGVIREGTRLSLAHLSCAAARPTYRKNRIRTIVVRSVARSIRILTRFSLFQHMLARLLRWTATIDVLAPTPLRSLSSHSKVASFTLRMFPHIANPLTASTMQKPSPYIVRLGSWQLGQYDPITESLLLPQSLRDAGLDSFIRQIAASVKQPWKESRNRSRLLPNSAVRRESMRPESVPSSKT